MKKVFRLFTGIVILFAAVCVLSIAALYMAADPNKLKPVISAEVVKRTGYKLVFDGDLSWSLYPQVGVKAVHITLTAPQQKRPFLDLRGVNIALELTQLFRGINKMQGEVHITEVTLRNVHASSALVGLHWQNKILTLRPLQASLYGGSLSGMVSGKNFATSPAWNGDVTLNHVDIKPFLRDANGDASKLKLSGIGQVRINVSTQGDNVKTMLDNLNGVTDFNIQNGAVEGIDLNYLLKTADAVLNRKPVEAPHQMGQTEFTSFVGSALINNGLAQSNNLVLTSSAFKVKGQGNYNLPQQAIDLDLLVQSQQELNTQWEIPVLVKGDVRHPSVGLDMRELNKIIAARELDKVKDKVEDKIKKISSQADKILQNLIGD